MVQGTQSDNKTPTFRVPAHPSWHLTRIKSCRSFLWDFKVRRSRTSRFMIGEVHSQLLHTEVVANATSNVHESTNVSHQRVSLMVHIRRLHQPTSPRILAKINRATNSQLEQDFGTVLICKIYNCRLERKRSYFRKIYRFFSVARVLPPLLSSTR